MRLKGTLAALGGASKPMQRQRGARILADHGAFAGEGESRPAAATPAPTKATSIGAVSSAALPVTLVFGTPESLTISLPWLPAGRRNALERKIGKQQDEQGLRLLAGDLAVDVDLRLAGLGGVAESARDERRHRTCRPCRRARWRRWSMSPSRAAHQADIEIRGASADRAMRAAHAFGQSEQFGDDAQAVGVGGSKSKIDPARRPVVADARCGLCRSARARSAAAKSSCSTSSVPPWSAKRASSLPAGMLGKQQLADAQGHAHVVAARSSCEQAPARRAAALVACSPTPASQDCQAAPRRSLRANRAGRCRG